MTTDAAPFQTATIRDAELFEVGNHRGEPYALADLKDMARNFTLGLGWIDPPITLGHEEQQPLVAGLAEGRGNTGEPAVGWVTSLRVARRKGKDGKARWVLLFSGHGIHPAIAGLINRRAYRKVSAEVYDDPPEGAPPACRGKMLRRVALLGGELPQIKTLADLPAATFAEAAGRFLASLRFAGGKARTADGKAWRVFSEVSPMDRGQLEEQLKALGWTDAQIEACKPLADDDFAALVNATLAQAAGADTGNGGGAATDAGAGAATGMVEWPPEAPSRDEVIAQLVAAGQDQATLDAMSDEELLALYQQKKGDTGAAPMSETPKKGARTFAEQLKRAVLADVRKELADVKRDIDSVKGKAAFLANDTARRRLAERGGAVKAYCERWLRDGYVLPAEVDPASKTPNLHHRLMNADGTRVKKYGEGLALSDFDAAVAEIESRGPGWARRNTRELVPDPEKGADPFGEKVKKYYETRLERLKRN